VFLFADSEITADALPEILAQMHRSFHATQQMVEKNQICGCTACIGAGGLKIKVVAHYGQALVRTIRRVHELTGECVIVAHRMLKNDVPIPEYALLSEEVARMARPEMKCRLVPSRLNLESFGEVQVSYLDLKSLAGEIPPATTAPWLLRYIAYVWHGVQAIPYRLGLKKPLEQFRNVPALP
jgi:hypothetical protein